MAKVSKTKMEMNNTPFIWITTDSASILLDVNEAKQIANLLNEWIFESPKKRRKV